MPCDQVRTTRVAWTEATDPNLVAKAMTALEYENVRVVAGVVRGTANDIEITVANGTLTARAPYGETFDESGLKQRYAAEVVKDRWAAMGWQVQEQGPTVKAAAGFTREW